MIMILDVSTCLTRVPLTKQSSKGEGKYVMIHLKQKYILFLDLFTFTHKFSAPVSTPCNQLLS